MAARKRPSSRKKGALAELRFLTDVVAMTMHRPMSRSHQDAIARFAARRLPARTIARLHTKSGLTAALAFIANTLGQPHISR